MKDLILKAKSTPRTLTKYLHMASSLFIDSDERLDLAGLIESRGFHLQSHEVTTQDGYILTLHRIVPPEFSAPENLANYNQTRKPIIVSHGLVSSSNDYFITSKELTSEGSKCGDNFGFGLLLTGRYDVWLPNNRGNGYSMKHVTMSTWNPNFWKFSFQHMAEYDLPAIIKYVQEETGHKTVGYVGHSQGCATMFALLAERPEYAEIVRPFIAWAPAVFLKNMKSSLAFMSRMLPFFQKLGGEFTPTDHLAGWFGEAICRNSLAQSLATREMSKMCGPTSLMNPQRLPVFFHFWPSPGSIWQIAHFGQMYKSGRFCKFDHGSAQKNKTAYGSERPPKYMLEKIPPNAVIVLMNGPTDYLVTPTDVERLFETLQPNVKTLIQYPIPADQFNHMDFLFATDAGQLVYDKTIEFLDQFV